MWIQDPMKLWNLFEILPVFYWAFTILTASTEKHNKSAEKENTQ